MLPDGEHQGLSFEDYLADPALGSTDLRTLLRSPLHYRHARNTQTPAKLRGSVIHCALLEPDALGARYMEAPEGLDRRTKAGKIMWEAAQQAATAAGCELVPAALWQQAMAVADAGRQLPALQVALEGGRAETSFICADQDYSGIRLKARADYYAPGYGKNGIVLDIKSTRDASARGFAAAVGRYGYHVQAAHYQQVVGQVMDRVPAFVILAIESTPPYALALYELAPMWLQEGRELIRKAKLIYFECKRTDRWGGYEPRVQTLSMPLWRMTDGASPLFGTFGDEDDEPRDLPGTAD